MGVNFCDNLLNSNYGCEVNVHYLVPFQDGKITAELLVERIIQTVFVCSLMNFIISWMQYTLMSVWS